MVRRHASPAGKLPRWIPSKYSTLFRRARQGNQRGKSKTEIGFLICVVRQLPGLDLGEHTAQLVNISDRLKQHDVGNARPGTAKSSELQGGVN